MYLAARRAATRTLSYTLPNTRKQQLARMVTHSRGDTTAEFHSYVNMSPEQIEEWLETPESKSCGMTRPGEHESVGRDSGHHIIEILRKGDDNLTDEDLGHMAKVVGYCKRHLAQRPHKTAEQLEHMKWTYSLRNWGHDPMQDEEGTDE